MQLYGLKCILHVTFLYMVQVHLYNMPWKCVTYIIVCFSLNIYLAKGVINTLIELSTSYLYK